MGKVHELTNPNSTIRGMRRGDYVKDAARALIAATSPSGRFLILRGGFVNFQIVAKQQFGQEADFAPTSTELRWMWDFLVSYVMRKERHLVDRFEAAYQKHLRKNAGKPTEAAEDTRIFTEKVEDGFMKERVH